MSKYDPQVRGKEIDGVGLEQAFPRMLGLDQTKKAHIIPYGEALRPYKKLGDLVTSWLNLLT
jgi:hypothetical protein